MRSARRSRGTGMRCRSWGGCRCMRCGDWGRRWRACDRHVERNETSRGTDVCGVPEILRCAQDDDSTSLRHDPHLTFEEFEQPPLVMYLSCRHILGEEELGDLAAVQLVVQPHAQAD